MATGSRCDVNDFRSLELAATIRTGTYANALFAFRNFHATIFCETDSFCQIKMEIIHFQAPGVVRIENTSNGVNGTFAFIINAPLKWPKCFFFANYHVSP